jgi:hypothetical protein
MEFEHSSENYWRVALELVAHIKEALDNPIGRKSWTEDNLNALRTFRVGDAELQWFPVKDHSKRSGLRGQFLWDFIGCTDQDVLVIAESEWLSGSCDLKHDFEKLLYTRCPVKLMICGRWNRDGATIAKELEEYARDCSSNFAPGEVFILFCTGWRNRDDTVRNDEVFYWQIPGEVCTNDGRDFEFKAFTDITFSTTPHR